MDLERLYRCITQLNQVMNRGVDLSVLLETIVRETAILLGADTTSVLLLDQHRQRLLVSASHGLSQNERTQIQFSPGEGVAGWVVAQGAPALVPDTEQDPRFAAFLNQRRAMRSMVAVPLLIRGAAIGVICATHPRPEWFTAEHVELMTFLAHSVVLDVENARLYRLAITDGLTGLYNRQHLAERLREEVDRAHRYTQPLTLLLVDLDHFKRVNDQHGHPVGDQVLEEVAARILAATRDSDLVARYGGEEFVALLPNTGRDGGQRAATRLLEAMREAPVATAAGALPITFSVGGALLNTREEPRDLLARADAALYQAKSQGRDRFVFNWLSFAGLS